MSGLYLFHFEPRYEHAGHYLGFATDIQARVAQHYAVGTHASPLIRATIRAGSRVCVSRVWIDGDRKLERRLKRQGGLSRHCPVCRATGKFHR